MEEWQQVLSELEPLPHGDRVRKCLAVGASSLNKPSLAAALDSACSHDEFFQAEMALYCCLGVDKPTCVSRCKRVIQESRSKKLRAIAQSILVDTAPEEQLPQVLLQLCGLASTPEAPGKLLQVLHRLRRAQRSTALALIVHEIALKADPAADVGLPLPGERLLEYTHLSGAPTIRRIALAETDPNLRLLLEQVLPFGTERQAALLAPILDSLSRTGSKRTKMPWPFLIQRHPRVAVELLVSLDKEDLQSILYVEGNCTALLQHCPAQAKSLFLSLGRLRKPMVNLVARLYQKFPAEIIGDLMSMHVDEDTDANDLQPFYTRAHATHLQYLAQRAAASANTAAAAPPPPAAPAAAAGPAGMDIDGSWVAPSSVGEVVSVSVDQEMEDVTEADPTAGGAAGGSPASESQLYKLLKLTPLVDVASRGWGVSFRLKRHRLAQLQNDSDLMQICLAGLQPTSHVLRKLSVPRRIGVFNAWKAWWNKQDAELQRLDGQVAGWSPEARRSAKDVRNVLEEHAFNTMWSDLLFTNGQVNRSKPEKEPNVKLRFCRYLPVSCLVQLVELLSTYPKSTAACKLLQELLPSQYVPPEAVATTLVNSPHLWAIDAHGAPLAAANSRAIFSRLSAAQQEQVLLSHFGIQTFINTTAMYTSFPAPDSVAELLMSGVTSHWDRATKLVYGEEGYDPAAPVVPEDMRQALRAGLFSTFIKALPDAQAVQELFLRLSWNWHRQDMVAADLMASLSLRPTAMEDMFKRWLASCSDRLSSSGSVYAATLDRLAQASGVPQYYQVLKAALELRELEVSYHGWLSTLTNTTHSLAPRLYRGSRHANKAPIAYALPAACRLELTRLAAREAVLHNPQVLLHLKEASTGPAQVLWLLAHNTAWWIQGWTSQQCEALLDEAPDLWKVIKDVCFLERVSPARRLMLFKSWGGHRQAMESQLANLLGATLDLSGSSGAAGQQAGGTVRSLVPGACILVERQVHPLIKQHDPLMGLPGSGLRKLLQGDGGLDGQLSRQMWEVVRHMVMSEKPTWLTWGELAALLPPDVRSTVARAKILRVMETQHLDPDKLFRAIKDFLPYLTFREILEHRGFKELVQSRDVLERETAATYLVTCCQHSISVLPQLLNWLHMKRREQDDVRYAVLDNLSGILDRITAYLHDQRIISEAEALADESAATRKATPHDKTMPELRGIEAAAAKEACSVWRAEGYADPDIDKQAKVLMDNLPGLALIIKDALAARDLSSKTTVALQQIIISMMYAAPEWAVQQWCALLAYEGISAAGIGQLIDWLDACCTHRSELMGFMWGRMIAARQEAVAGKPTPSDAHLRKQEESEDDSADGEEGIRRKRLRRSKGKHGRNKPPAESKVPKFKGDYSDLLQEAQLLWVVQDMLPAALLVLQNRQGGLAASLNLLMAVVEYVVAKGPGNSGKMVINIRDKLEPALTKVVLSILPQVSAVPEVKSLTGSSNVSDSIPLLAWYSNRILLWAPDEYMKLKHLLLKDIYWGGNAIWQAELCQSLSNIMPLNRFDLLLPFMLENRYMPTAAFKAVLMMFWLHPEQVAATVPKLLAADATFLLVPPVFWYVMRRRQDLVPSLIDPEQNVLDVWGENCQGLFDDGVSTNQLYNLHSPNERTRGRTPLKGNINLAGWSNRHLDVSLWLAFPEVSSTMMAKLSASKQIMIGKELMMRMNHYHTLDVHVVRSIMRLLTALPALPAQMFLDLLQTASGDAAAPMETTTTDAATTTADADDKPAAAAAAPEGALAGEAVQDILLSAVVRLDNFSHAWDALLVALKKGESATALGAVAAMLAEDIRALQVEGTDATAAESSKVLAVLGKIFDLPWQRPSVMKQVIKLLGMLASRSKMALAKLLVIAQYAAAGMTGGAQPVGLPLAPGKPLHRSAHLQLLTTLKDFYHEEAVRAVFQLSATSPDKEIAISSATVPGFDLQRRAPASVQACVALFIALLEHPELEVRQQAMEVWSAPGEPVPFQAGVQVVDRLLTSISRLTAQRPKLYNDPVALTRLDEEVAAAERCCTTWMSTAVKCRPALG